MLELQVCVLYAKEFTQRLQQTRVNILVTSIKHIQCTACFKEKKTENIQVFSQEIYLTTSAFLFTQNQIRFTIFKMQWH